jgi:O-antigen/teichoic acid export membrane protein
VKFFQGNLKKIISRVTIIISGGVFRVIGAFSNLIISLFIIRSQSAALWGEVVYFILLIDLAFSIVNWGQTPYLVREFSMHPKKIQTTLLQSFLSRTGLLILFIITLSFIKPDFFLTIAIWCVCRFIYQSFDALTLFERNFKFSISVELIGITIIIVPTAFSWIEPNVINILYLYALSFLFRAVTTLVFYRKKISRLREQLSLPKLQEFFVPAFPFFLLTLSAMLQQRADLYTVALYLSPTETAQYQVFLNLLIFNQTCASFILSPFSKNIFRLPQKSLAKVEVKFAKAGLILSLLSIVFIHLVVTYIYRLNYPFIMYVTGYFYILFFYFYQIKNYELGKAYKQITVAFYSFSACAVNLIVSILLTPSFGIEGALIAGLATQIFLVMLYHKNKILQFTYASR